MGRSAADVKYAQEQVRDVLYEIQKKIGKLNDSKPQNKLFQDFIEKHKLSEDVAKVRSRLSQTVCRHRQQEDWRTEDIFKHPAATVLEESYLKTIGFKQPKIKASSAARSKAPSHKPIDEGTRKTYIVKLNGPRAPSEGPSTSKRRADSLPLGDRGTKRPRLTLAGAESSEMLGAERSESAPNPLGSNEILPAVTGDTPHAVAPEPAPAVQEATGPDEQPGSARVESPASGSIQAAHTEGPVRDDQPSTPDAQRAQEQSDRVRMPTTAISPDMFARFDTLSRFRHQLGQAKSHGRDNRELIRDYFDAQQLGGGEQAIFCYTTQCDEDLRKDEIDLISLYQRVLGESWRQKWRQVNAQPNAGQYRADCVLESLVAAGVFNFVIASDSKTWDFGKQIATSMGDMLGWLENAGSDRTALARLANTATYDYLDSEKGQTKVHRLAEEAAERLAHTLRPHVKHIGRPFGQQEIEALHGMFVKAIVIKGKIDAYEGRGTIRLFWPSIGTDLDAVTMTDGSGDASEPRKIVLTRWPGFKLIREVGEDVLARAQVFTCKVSVLEGVDP